MSVPALLLAAAAAAEVQRPPGLVERVAKDLVQIDVAVDGPPDRKYALTLEDFALTVGGKKVVPVALDRLCDDPAAGGASAAAPTSYLFYFDQRMLTMRGRSQALETATQLIRTLVRDGARGSIVSSAGRVETIAPFTESADALVQAIDRLRERRDHFDEYATLEPTRKMQMGGCSMARVHQQEEAARAGQSVQIFGTVLGRFDALDPPKVALYFGDTLRQFPGRHYLGTGSSGCASAYPDVPMSFEPVHDAAAVHGVKVYAVEAQGLTASYPVGNRSTYEDALHDAQGGLKTLALETGGAAFLGGTKAESMSGRIEADAACVYLLSFDPASFPEDEPLAVRVEIDEPKVRARTRTHTIIRSESSRRVATLLAAFTAPEEAKSVRDLRPRLLPLDVVEGKLRVLFQAALPETALPGEAWDLGLSVFSGTSVTHEDSARVTVEQEGVPIVLESVAVLKPAPFEVTMVGMEELTGDIAAARMRADWPAQRETVEVLSIGVTQKQAGAFVREGKAQPSGAWILSGDDAVRSGEAVTLSTLVCRPGKKAIRVERTLSGYGGTLAPRELTKQDGPCVTIRDEVPAGALDAGAHTYTVWIDGTDVTKSRTIQVQN